MKSFFYTCMMLIVTSCFLQGCNSKEAPLDTSLRKAPVFDETTPLGREIKNLYDLYDVRFDYKWDRHAFAYDVIADPADINDVLPYLEVTKVLYFEAINKVSGDTNYSKNETPLTIYLMGSGINYGGTQSGGEGSAGQAGNIQPNRLSLGGLNEFGEALRVKGPTGDEAFLKSIFDKSISSFPGEAGHVGFIYHEYTHYIDSKHDIPKNFEKPAFDNYLRGSNAYRNLSDDYAREKGFMLPYGMQNEHEDLATYVQIMVWKPKEEIERTILVSSVEFKRTSDVVIAGIENAKYLKTGKSEDKNIIVLDGVGRWTINQKEKNFKFTAESGFTGTPPKPTLTKTINVITKEKYKMVYKYYKDLGLDLFKLQEYLHTDAVKQKLLDIKHKYDGTTP